MSQSTRPKPPAGGPRPGQQPPGSRGSAGRPAPAGTVAPRSLPFSLPAIPRFPGAPGTNRPPGATGKPGAPGRAAPAAGPTWRTRVSRADRERTRERLVAVLLSSILALCILLVGGALLWEKVIIPLRPVARLDGQAITLGAYTDALAYRQNVLLSEYEQVQQLAAQPTAAAGSGGNDFLAQYARQRASQIQNQLAGLSTQLVDDMVDERLIRAEAARRGLTATPEEVDRQLKSLVGYQDPAATPSPAPSSSPAPADAAAQAPDAAPAPAATAAPTVPLRRPRDFEAVYRDYRRATAGTDAVVRSDVTAEILRGKLDEQLSAAVASQTEQVHARHILLPDETAAAAAMERLNNGESFEALAAELSTDPGSKDEGGDLGWFPRGFMVGAFEDAAFKLQPGQVSGPVKTSFGVHLIRVDERDAARDLDPQQLQALKSSALPRWLESERANHKVENLLTADQQDWASRNGRKPSFGQG